MTQMVGTLAHPRIVVAILIEVKSGKFEKNELTFVDVSVDGKQYYSYQAFKINASRAYVMITVGSEVLRAEFSY